MVYNDFGKSIFFTNSNLYLISGNFTEKLFVGLFFEVSICIFAICSKTK